MCTGLLLVAACSPLSLPAPLVVSAGDWPMFGKNIAHTGFEDSAAFTFPL